MVYYRDSHWGMESNPSVEIQSVNSTARAEWVGIMTFTFERVPFVKYEPSYPFSYVLDRTTVFLQG